MLKAVTYKSIVCFPCTTFPGFLFEMLWIFSFILLYITTKDTTLEEPNVQKGNYAREKCRVVGVGVCVESG